ncbi:MAG: helix-turn-helix domain-containing protein [Lachnospiraceae bacterium]|nr:helix-turn-helix domain-containing protein [Lachnospiraceae bacterium]
MTIGNRIKRVRELANFTQVDLAAEINVSKQTLYKYENDLITNIPSDKIELIAEKCNATPEYLMGWNKNEIITCHDCGLSYDASYADDVEAHSREHELWESASKKFGKLYCYTPECERLKAEGRNGSHNKSLSLNERMNFQLQVLRCLFSRSIQANNYNLKHVDFDKYVSMMLGNKSYRKNMEDDLYEVLTEKYGTSHGISYGSVYYVPNDEPTTIAAHFDGTEYTEEQLERIKAFAAFIKTEEK